MSMKYIRINFYICFLFAFIAVLSSPFRLKAQVKNIERQKLIEASQSGSMPLYFNLNQPAIPVAVTDTFNHKKEFYLRDGLPNFFNKVRRHKKLKIGYLGGSITRADNEYRVQSAKFIQSLYPAATMTGINAGVSGTDADLGACRLYDQLLRYHPDLIFIEFAVNGAFAPGVEGIIRQVWRFDPHIDICMVYTIYDGQQKYYQTGSVPPNIAGLEKIAEHYQIPSVHMGLYPSLLQQQNQISWRPGNTADSHKIFTSDGVHPTLLGGNIYGSAIARAFSKFKHARQSMKHALPAPLIADNWEDGTMSEPRLANFKGDWQKIIPAKDSLLNQFAGWFSYVMKASQPGSSFSFKFKGKSFGFFDIGGPEVAQLEVYVDGKRAQPVGNAGLRVRPVTTTDSAALINRFNVYCNNRYRGQFEMFNVSDGEHSVRFVISSAKANKQQILGVSQQADITAHPEKYNQTMFYLGKILVRGIVHP